MFKNIYTPIIAIIASIAIGYFVALPEYQVFNKAKADIVAREQLLKDLEKVKTMIEKRKKDYHKNFEHKDISHPDKHLLVFEQVISQQAIDELRLLINIYELPNRPLKGESYFVRAEGFDGVSLPKDNASSDGGVGFNGEQTGTQEKSSILDKGEVSFTFLASYGDFKKFLDRVEKNAKILDVISISFGEDDNGDSSSEEGSDSESSGSTQKKIIDENTIFNYDVTFRTYQLAK